MPSSRDHRRCGLPRPSDWPRPSEWFATREALADGREEGSHGLTGLGETSRGVDRRTDTSLKRLPLRYPVPILVERWAKRIWRISAEGRPTPAEGLHDGVAQRLTVEIEVLGECCHVPEIPHSGVGQTPAYHGLELLCDGRLAGIGP